MKGKSIALVVVFLLVYILAVNGMATGPPKDNGVIQGKIIIKSEDQGRPSGFTQNTGVSSTATYTIYRDTLIAGKVPIKGYESPYLGGLLILPDYVKWTNFKTVHKIVIYGSLILIISIIVYGVVDKYGRTQSGSVSDREEPDNVSGRDRDRSVLSRDAISGPEERD